MALRNTQPQPGPQYSPIALKDLDFLSRLPASPIKPSFLSQEYVCSTHFTVHSFQNVGERTQDGQTGQYRIVMFLRAPGPRTFPNTASPAPPPAVSWILPGVVGRGKRVWPVPAGHHSNTHQLRLGHMVVLSLRP